jgi:DASS family divalent anion:Na+ symporter
VALLIWFVPPPGTLSVQAWRSSRSSRDDPRGHDRGVPDPDRERPRLAAAVLTGILTPNVAYTAFANPTIVLIIVAFLVARAVVKCGLGQRLGHRAISLFGRSTLGLSYAIFAVDALIAPAFPSNTARSGVIYPLALSMAEAAGVSPSAKTESASRSTSCSRG